MIESNTSDAALAELLTLTMVLTDDGMVEYFNPSGQTHRVYGPAIIYQDGTQHWCQYDYLHRVDGPAIVNPDGTPGGWWIDGEPVDGACEWKT